MTSAPGRGVPPSVLLRSLAEGRATTRRMAGELLTHVPDVGNPSTQRLLDAWVEQAADTLLALSDAFEERLLGSGRTPSAGDHARAHR